MSGNIFEQIIYRVRSILWRYPDILFFGKKSMAGIFSQFYLRVRPISHIIITVIIIGFLTSQLAANVQVFVSADEDTLIEGVLVGVDDAGNLNTIQKVNPLVVTNVQLEKDLNELIYQSLVEIGVDGEVEEVLAETIARNEDNSNYRVKLREDVYWHDGEKFTANDVKATFELLEKLDVSSSTATFYSRSANKRIKFVEIPGDNYRFEFELDGFVPNFYELISFKILPAKYIEELNTFNILTIEPFINSNPIGTGKFKLDDAGSDFIQLTRNEDYYKRSEIPKIEKIRFQFFSELDSVLKAISTGQIHSIAGLSSTELGKLKTARNLNVYKTDVIYTQYYGMYFNLSESGPEIFKDKKVRQAISAAINRDYLVEILEQDAEKTLGPIPKESFAYADNITRYDYNFEQANQLLDEAGWNYEDGNRFRSKNGETLEFKLLALENIDRNKVSDSIVDDLESIGISVEIVRKPYLELVNQHVLTRNFPAMLFGVSTFVDPDRYEFFHSSQIIHPGLNLSSYASAEETVRVNDDNEIETIPEVDVRLEEGRSFEDIEERVKAYYDFQRIVAEESPVVFLYHPVLNYTVNDRVKRVEIENADSLEERFDTIDKWFIEF